MPGPTDPRPSIAGRALLLLAVFLTGATALAYEVAWTRGLVVVLGSTALTASVVLAVFVGSLGLGAVWGGRVAERSPRPLVLYGKLEALAAAWAVLALLFVGLLRAPYVWLASALPDLLTQPLRILMVAVIVAPGSFLLGATLPAVVRHWVRQDGETGRGTAWAYGANTLGAVLGALATGFVLVGALGVTGTLYVAAAVAIGVGAVAILIGTRLDARDVAGAPEARGRAATSALFAAFLCGLVGLGIEIAGFRLLVFFVEGFTVTFAAMLATFVLGLGLASFTLGPLLVRGRHPERWIALLLALAAAVVVVELLVVVPQLEGWMKDVKAWAYEGADAPVQGLQLAALAGSLAVLFLPAFVLGATFPLTVRQAELCGLSPGQAVGRVYLANSLGTLLAPFLVTFLVVPHLGPGGAWALLAAVAAAGSIAVLLQDRSRLVAWGGVAGVVALAFVLLGSPEPGRRLVEASHIVVGRPDRKVLAVDSDPVTTASVIETGEGEKILYTDDFAAAATGRHYRYMRMLGHLPVLLAAEPENAMVIAYGTGTTAGAVAAHEDVKRLEVVEVSRAVLDLAPYFLEASRSVLLDKRTRVIRDDGRNVLLLHEPDLDVITLEPLMPYSPAGLPFYTREFYELAASRLDEGGILCQWVPVHAMPAWLYASLVRTFFETFPDGSIWFFEQSTALIARKGKKAPDALAIARRRAAIAEDLAAAGAGTDAAFAAGFVASGRRVLEADVPSPDARRVVRDLDPFPEFHPSPRAPLHTTYLADTLQWLESLVDDEDQGAELRGMANASALTRTLLRARLRDAEATWLATYRRYAPVDAAAAGAEELTLWNEAVHGYAAAAKALGAEPVTGWRHARAAGRLARLRAPIHLASSKRRAARRELEAALRIDRDEPEAAERVSVTLMLARVLLQEGRCKEVERRLESELDLGGYGRRSRRILEDLRAAVRTWKRDSSQAPAGPFASFFVRPCSGDSTPRLAGAWEDYQAAAAAGVGSSLRARRRLQLAADALLAVAQDEGRVDDVRGKVGEVEHTEPWPRAVQAGLISVMTPGDDRFGRLFRSSRVDVVEAALREAGRRKRLTAHARKVEEFAKTPHTTLRAALADAVAADGSKDLFRPALPLLMDPDLSVRTSAATIYFRAYPSIMSRYDPQGDEASRQAVVDRLEATLR